MSRSISVSTGLGTRHPRAIVMFVLVLVFVLVFVLVLVLVPVAKVGSPLDFRSYFATTYGPPLSFAEAAQQRWQSDVREGRQSDVTAEDAIALKSMTI